MGLDAIEPADLAVCEALLAAGSKSFSAAGRLLPRRSRPSITALYAFCRIADDLIDEGDGAAGLVTLRRRLTAIYAGTPEDHAVDRAFAVTVRRHGIPRGVVDLLIEGFEWDLAGRRYVTAADTVAYGVRVASTVGVMMTLIMGPRDRTTLARAADLGVAMQLTNIARDVGEDARNGRVYLPGAWLAEAGAPPDALGVEPRFSPPVGEVVARLLATADGLYRRADTGIGRLPRRVRLAITAASSIYRAIGDVIARNGHDSVSTRARTGRGRKLLLLLRALRAAFWTPPLDPAPPLPEAVALLDAVDAAT
ncbi:MAG: phytoene/squalene synthase family protein [Myxococcales bacterium]|nr:phytoene/squalene synthase family protein [Myxococcales bacterium]